MNVGPVHFSGCTHSVLFRKSIPEVGERRPLYFAENGLATLLIKRQGCLCIIITILSSCRLQPLENSNLDYVGRVLAI